MGTTLFGFKKYLIAEEMDPSVDKTIGNSMPDKKEDAPKYRDYFQSLADEHGIEWKNLVKIFENEPWISAHFALGKPGKEIMYKLSAWEIVPNTLSTRGCMIRLKPQANNRAYLKGQKLLKGDYQDKNSYFLNREQLLKFLTTGWTPAASGQAGGGMGGGII